MVTKKEGLSCQTTGSPWWRKMEKWPCVCLFVSRCVSESWFMYSGWMVAPVVTAVTLSGVQRSSCVTQSVSTCVTLQHHLKFPAAVALWRASASICDLINSPVGGDELMTSSSLFDLACVIVSLPSNSAKRELIYCEKDWNSLNFRWHLESLI